MGASAATFTWETRHQRKAANAMDSSAEKGMNKVTATAENVGALHAHRETTGVAAGARTAQRWVLRVPLPLARPPPSPGAGRSAQARRHSPDDLETRVRHGAARSVERWLAAPPSVPCGGDHAAL